MADIIDYEISCLNETDYLVLLNMEANKTFFYQLYEKTNKKLKVKGETPNIEEFDLPPDYFTAVKGILKKQIKELKRIMEEDKIIPLSMVVKGGRYKLEGDKVKVKIVIGGLYEDRR
jgi:hypothetical protein